MQGEIHVGRHGRIDAEELGRRHADDGERHVVDQNRLSGRIVGAAETALAVPFADNCDRRRTGAIVVGSHQTARGGNHGQPAKEVASHVLTRCDLGGALDDHVHFSGSEVAEDAGQHRLRNLLQAFEGRERENEAALAVRFVVEGTADGAQDELGAVVALRP